MPFGLQNYPKRFQRTLELIRSGVRFSTCLVYLDDALVFPKSVEDIIKHFVEVLQLLQDASVSLKHRKFSFRKTVDYLGHLLLPGRLALSKDSIYAIADWNFIRIKQIFNCSWELATSSASSSDISAT